MPFSHFFYPNGTKVWRSDFWMGHHGAPCPKRTSIWSNSWEVIAKLVWSQVTGPGEDLGFKLLEQL